MFFKNWRANRIRIKIARLEGEAGAIELRMNSGNKYPSYHVDMAVAKRGKIAGLKKKLEILTGGK